MTDGAAAPGDWEAGYDAKTVLQPFKQSIPVDLYKPKEDYDGSLLVALHGQGMSAKAFARRVLPLAPAGCTVLIPQAPLPFEFRQDGKFHQGNSWYIYLGDDDLFLRSMESAEDWIVGLVDRYQEFHGLDPEAVSLLGFSQGGYLAGYVGLRNAKRFRRLVVAGARVKHEVLEDHARRVISERPDFELLAVHGDKDESVLPETAKQSLDVIGACGVPVTYRTYGTGHGVLASKSCREDVKAFLQGQIG